MPIDDAKAAGRSAFEALRIGMAERLAKLLRKDPELVANAVEVGLVDRDWLEEPGKHPMSTATTLDVVQRFLERSVEQRPSALAAIGLNAIQALSWSSEDKVPGKGTTTSRLTVVFTDLEGFTRYTDHHGDEAASALLVEHHRIVGPLIRGRGGRTVKRLGDGLLLCFPEPEAAVKAMLELVDAAPAPLRLRAGGHLGEVVVTRDDLIGHVVNLSARVAESAKGGEVLVTTDVRDAVGELRGVRFGRARRRTFKGVNDVVRVCPVLPA